MMKHNELLVLLENGESPVIIDVRSTFEYKIGCVQGAIHIPFWQTLVTDKLTHVDKTQALVVYCEHGPRAIISKLLLALLGFKNISYLEGHMMRWRKLGLPMERK